MSRVGLMAAGVLAACSPHATAPVAPLTPPVFAIACAAQCGGAFAQLTVYRDDGGNIGLVTMQGGPDTCSDARVLFFGPDGTPREGLPFGVVSGTPEAANAHDLFTAQTRGLHKSETPLCRDVAHKPP